MNKNLLISLFLIIIATVSCVDQSISDSDYMKLDEVSYVKQFPQSFVLTDEMPAGFDIIGMRCFRFCDSLFIATTKNRDGLWSFYSMNTNQWLGDFLYQGNGPNEFVQAPYVSNSRFSHKDDHLFAEIEDFELGKLYKMDITKSLQTKELNISLMQDSLPTFLFDFVVIDSSTFFCREIANKQTQQIRYILRDGNKETPANLEKLNRATIEEGEDFNILSTITKSNAKGDLIVEIPISLNQINLYSIKDDFGKTICCGDKLDNIDKIQNKLKWMRKYTYGGLMTYDAFFATLYINETNMAYQTKHERCPDIQLFNWKGEPLAELKLNRFATSFDIDFTNGYLYTLDALTDEFYKYDIRDILEKLQKEIV